MYNTIGTDRDNALLIIQSAIETYREVVESYGQEAFYSDSEAAGRESVYWSKKEQELKDFLKKYSR